MNLRINYYADGAYRTVITAVRNGEFEFFARSSHPAILEICDYERKPLGRLLAKNGTNYKIDIVPGKPYSVQSSGDINGRWSSYLRDNASALEEDANGTVAKYIFSHPDDILSTILLLTEFDASKDAMLADSLLSSIDLQARPSTLTEGFNFTLERLVTASALEQIDSLVFLDRHDVLSSFNPGHKPVSLISFTATGKFRTDSLLPTFRRLQKGYKDKIELLDYHLDPDTLEWKYATRRDSANWNHGWAPGAVSAPAIASLAIPTYPFFIVCDSVGNEIYRGPHLGVAEKLCVKF